jgi:hypothetical protein
MKKSKTINFFKDQIQVLKYLKPNEAGEIIIASLKFVDGEDYSFSSKILEAIFEPIKNTLIRNQEEYESFISKQSEKGKKSGLSRANQTEPRLTIANQTEPITSTNTLTSTNTNTFTETNTKENIIYILPEIFETFKEYLGIELNQNKTNQQAQNALINKLGSKESLIAVIKAIKYFNDKSPDTPYIIESLSSLNKKLDKILIRVKLEKSSKKFLQL